jgi:hypothetical protein
VLRARFGSDAEAEDAFDGMLGALQMVEVAEGRRPMTTEDHAAPTAWDGWILGW